MPRDDCAQPEVARKDLETEIDILQRLQHPNIVEMLGAGFVNPQDVDAADGEERGEFRDLDQASVSSMSVLRGLGVGLGLVSRGVSGGGGGVVGDVAGRGLHTRYCR